MKVKGLVAFLASLLFVVSLFINSQPAFAQVSAKSLILLI